MLFIRNATVYTPDPLPGACDVLVEATTITRILRHGILPPPAEARVIEARGLLLVPGFIDLQVNGAFGYDFTADPTTIQAVAAGLPRFGVTAFLPTIVTSPPETVAAAQQIVCDRKPAERRAAEALGLHVEGPFLNPAKKGAHNPAYLRLPDADLAAPWTPANGVRLVTLAPELPGACDLARYLAGRGVVVSAGHSLATFEDAQAGFAAGIRYGTHLFNAMPPLGHREPGLVGALLAEESCVGGLINDGIHVHPAVVALIWAAKGPAGLNLVSDAMAGLGMAPGRYVLNDLEVSVSATEARLPDGTLAGSVVALDGALRNLIAFSGCSLSQALATITTTPARVLGLAGRRGALAPGLPADLVLLTPDLHVVLTVTAGSVAYEQGDA